MIVTASNNIQIFFGEREHCLQKLLLFLSVTEALEMLSQNIRLCDLCISFYTGHRVSLSSVPRAHLRAVFDAHSLEHCWFLFPKYQIAQAYLPAPPVLVATRRHGQTWERRCALANCQMLLSSRVMKLHLEAGGPPF